MGENPLARAASQRLLAVVRGAESLRQLLTVENAVTGAKGHRKILMPVASTEGQEKLKQLPTLGQV